MISRHRSSVRTGSAAEPDIIRRTRRHPSVRARRNAGEAEHTLITVSSNLSKQLKQNAGEVEHTLTAVSSSVNTALRQNAEDLERALIAASTDASDWRTPVAVHSP